MSSYKQYARKAIVILVFIVITLQIVIGLFWMIRNFSSIPQYGDTPEYLKLSQTLMLDEYRSILYPLFLRIIIDIANKMFIPHHVLVYILQSFACYTALLNFFRCLINILEKKFPERFQNIWMRKGFVCLFTLYIFTIPMIMHYNLTVLTDSFALSLLIVLITYLICFLQGDSFTISMVRGIIISVVLQSLLRPERLYTSIFFICICCLVKFTPLVKKLRHDENNNICKKFICKAGMIIVIPILITNIVNYYTQTPGLYGRPQMNSTFILLNRIVWPHMASNYEEFSVEIKDVISKDMAVQVDSSNNNVSYLFVPLMEKAVGKERASELYLEMAKVVLKNQSEKVLFDIGEDITTFLCFPITIAIDSNGYHISTSDWSYSRMAESHGITTMYYYKFAMYSFMIIMIPLFIYMWTRKNSFTREIMHVLRPMIWLSIILALCFSIESGALPNPRYGIIVFMCWGVAGLMSYLDCCSQ